MHYELTKTGSGGFYSECMNVGSKSSGRGSGYGSTTELFLRVSID